MSVYLVTAIVYFEMIFVVYYAYDRPLGLPEFLVSTTYAIMTMMFILGICASFEHVSSLYHRISSNAMENLNLLNGMHEGLIIFKKPTSVANGERTPMFCNKPAYKVIKQINMSTEYRSVSESVAFAQIKKVFDPINYESDMMSIDDLILSQ